MQYTVHSTHTPAGYFHLLKWKETNKSALAQAGPPRPGPLPPLHSHTKVLGLFWQAASLLFCFMGLGGGGACFAALPVIRRLCLWACEKGSSRKINTSSTHISSSVWRVWGGNELGRGYSACYGFDMNLAPGVSECDGCIILSSCLCSPDSGCLSGWNNIPSLAFGRWWSIIIIMAVIIEQLLKDLLLCQTR